MAPAKKKQRIIVDGKISPDAVSPVQQRTRDGENVQTDEEIKTLIKNLRRCRSVNEAKKAIKAIVDVFEEGEPDENFKQNAAEKFSEFQGVENIICALKYWHHDHSHEFSKLAICSLAYITLKVPKSRQSVVNVGGIDAVLEADKNDKNHNDYYCLAINVIWLLRNLSRTKHEDPQELAEAECIAVAMEIVKKFPEDDDIQEAGCEYFYQIVQLENVKPILREKKIGSVLMAAWENFPNSQAIQKWTGKAMHDLCCKR